MAALLVLLKPDSEFYTFKVIGYENLVGYYPFDTQTIELMTFPQVS